jgi:hypothetical protein
MCSRHQPENGADSAPVEQPMEELPRPNRQVILHYLKDALPGATDQELQTEASKVEMADALGRAIHAVRRIGGLWPAPCVRERRTTEGEVTDVTYEQVPYGWGDQQECLCEQMALHLVELMHAGSIMETVKSGEGRIVLPKGVVQ